MSSSNYQIFGKSQNSARGSSVHRQQMIPGIALLVASLGYFTWLNVNLADR
jgi:hypothetical protein